MDSQIDEIKNKLNIIDIIGGYLKLTKTGINYRGVCPFHSEKTPSFFVSPSRQMWHCFGCGAGSSLFDFIMKIEGVEFGDALRILAAKAGVELKRENPKLRTERQRLYEVCDLACAFFEKQLEGSSIGQEAKAYLLKRGIKEENIKKWRLGYSPDTWNGLTDFLIGKGYKREEVIKSGLAIPKENDAGDSYDRFRGRIIFPVFDLNSQVVGFGGRVFKQEGKEIAKYINTPQTLLYDKSGILYGLNFGKVPVRKKNQCIVTEGYTDVIMSHQAGFENTVGASGTALTQQHLYILKRYSDNLVLAFDMDVAGDSATKRGISLAQEQGFNIKIIESYIKDSDPADIILKDASVWEKAVGEARSIMDYYFDSAFSSFDKGTPEGKKEIGRVVLPAIKRLQNKIEQSYWVQRLAEMLGVREEAILEELLKIKGGPALAEKAPEASKIIEAATGTEARKKLIEEKIISLILKNPGEISLVDESYHAFFSDRIQVLLRELKKIIGGQDPVGEALETDLKKAFSESLSRMEIDAELKNFTAALVLKAEAEYGQDGQEEMQLCLLQLKTLALKQRLSILSGEIKQAEKENNREKAATLIDAFNALTKEL